LKTLHAHDAGQSTLVFVARQEEFGLERQLQRVLVRGIDNADTWIDTDQRIAQGFAEHENRIIPRSSIRMVLDEFTD
jgi:hypothetical protein